MLLNKVKTPSDHRAAIRGVMGGKTFSKTDKITRNYAKVGSRQTKMFQGHFGCLNLLKFRFPALITRRSQVRVLSPKPQKVLKSQRFQDFYFIYLFPETVFLVLVS